MNLAGYARLCPSVEYAAVKRAGGPDDGRPVQAVGAIGNAYSAPDWSELRLPSSAFAVGGSATGSDTLPPARPWRTNSRGTEDPNSAFLRRGCEPDLWMKAKVLVLASVGPGMSPMGLWVDYL